MSSLTLWRIAHAVAIVFLMTLGGCATVADARASPGQRLDPWEGWNRKVFAFNEGLDKAVLKPVATGYVNVVPSFVRHGVDNFFANVADGWSAVNNVLQGKGEPALGDVVRFTTNTVFGFLGVLDIASEFGLEHHHEDFGQTLGAWGFGAGAYVVLPLLGPSSVRDTLALSVDRFASPTAWTGNGTLQIEIAALQGVTTRARLLGAGQVIDDASLDKYTFMRDAYLQRRRSLVFDGNPPELPDPSRPATP